MTTATGAIETSHAPAKSARSTTMRWVFVALLLGVAAASAYAFAKWDQWMVWPELRKPVLATLKDPDSALFRNQFVGRKALCGEVNARNGMGGYAGYARFIAGGERFALEGASTLTWYGSDKDTQQIIAELEKVASLTRTLQRKPTEAEVQGALFSDLWNERCDGVV